MNCRAFIASPYAGDIERNVAYARECVADSLARGESPFAPHLLYPQVLDDGDEDQRRQGMDAGIRWGSVAHVAAFYVDNGESPGMARERRHFEDLGIECVTRSLRR
ncbi:MAG: hypothetical protein GY946_22015 [bacterium]|nr:hypothetical protein [bacterium]